MFYAVSRLSRTPIHKIRNERLPDLQAVQWEPAGPNLLFGTRLLWCSCWMVLMVERGADCI